jgi:hypothetical protein
VAQDSVYNYNTAASQLSLVYDGTAPTVSMSSTASNPTNTSPIPVTVTFSESVTGFTSGDIVAGNATVGNFSGSGASYTFDLTPSGNGSVTADIAASVAQDFAGNNTAAAQFSRTYDGTAPTVTSITRDSLYSNPTNASSAGFIVGFSESGLTGLDTSDFTLTTTGSISGASVTSVSQFAGVLWTVTVNTGSGDGTIRLDLTDDDSITDAAGNKLGGIGTGNGNYTAGQIFTIDKTGPTVSMSSTASDPTNTSPIPVTVTFSESVTGFTAGDITSGNATVSNLTGSGTSYAFDLTPSGNGAVTADIAAGVAQDSAGNGNTAATQFSRIYDAIAPSVTSFTATSPTNSLNIPITAFAASDAVGVSGYLITESATPPSAGAAGWAASAPTTYIVAGDGSYTLYPWAKDAAGNVSAAYGSPAGVTVETAAPSVVSIVRADASPTNAVGVDFIVTFSEVVSGVDTSDFSLVAATGLTGASVTGVSGGSKVYTVSVNTGSGSGTLRLDLLDNDSIADGASNPLGGSGSANGDFVTGQLYTIDKTAPTAGSLVAANVTTGGGATHSFTVVFSDNLAVDGASLDGSDIRVTGPGGFNQLATLVSATPAGNGTPRTATYQITAPGGAWDSVDEGSYTIAIEANQVFDSAGNPVGATSLGGFLVSLKYTTYLPLVL